MMKLQELEGARRQLDRVPPSPENWNARLPLLERLDALFSEPELENDPVLNRFYHEQCRRVIAEVRTWRGPGVRLWKLYSSAILVKDETGLVTGFDLNEGCTPACERRTRLRLSPGLVEEFAELVGRMFYTHGHLDHLGLAVADALLMRGKPVIAPGDAVRRWLLDGAVPAEEFQAEGVRCYRGAQRMADKEDVPNSAYAVTFQPGVTLLVRGDIYHWEELKPIYDRIESQGVKIDMMATSPFYQSGPDPVQETYRRFGCGFIPIHEWEFGHRLPVGRGGRATQTYADLYESFRIPGEAGKCAVLAWGESAGLHPTVSTDRREEYEKSIHTY
ncbi:hypothetical protein [Victivallis vadensis]|uniref:hypothetical protein n=1 Tax=Victivallis vadensis TaxID=172901 RepID=UPI0023F588D8|nr:hypothetical protein [Victivallis vadensis]